MVDIRNLGTGIKPLETLLTSYKRLVVKDSAVNAVCIRRSDCTLIANPRRSATARSSCCPVCKLCPSNGAKWGAATNSHSGSDMSPELVCVSQTCRRSVSSARRSSPALILTCQTELHEEVVLMTTKGEAIALGIAQM